MGGDGDVVNGGDVVDGDGAVEEMLGDGDVEVGDDDDGDGWW